MTTLPYLFSLQSILHHYFSKTNQINGFCLTSWVYVAFRSYLRCSAINSTSERRDMAIDMFRSWWEEVYRARNQCNSKSVPLGKSSFRSSSYQPQLSGGRWNHTFHHSIKTPTTRTLHSQEMPMTIFTLRFTIIASNVDNPRQVRRHGLQLNITRTCHPCLHHGSTRHYRLFAYRTSIVKGGQIAKTVWVNGMPAGQFLGWETGGEHILATYRTRIFVFVRHA